MSDQDHLDCLAETLPVKLPDGESIEATVAYGDCTDPGTFVLILPPNPILGGDSRNNVIRALLAETASRNLLGVSCDYRGVANGYVGDRDVMSYWEDLLAGGDYALIVDDLLTLADAVRTEFSVEGPCAGIIGYSFGSYLALACARALRVQRVVGISPPIRDHDFLPLLNAAEDIHFLVAPEDIFCPPDLLRELQLQNRVKIRTIDSDDHFFRGYEHVLATEALAALGFAEIVT